MMNRYTYLLLLIFFLSSCNADFLDTSPTDQWGDKEVFSSQSGAYAALNGIHRKMVAQYSTNMMYGGEPSMCIFRDCLGEDVVVPSTKNGYFVAALQWQDHRNSASETVSFPFKFYYSLILQSNLILESIGTGVDCPFPVMDTLQLEGIRGEAYCFRAWGHFQLVQLYGKRYVAGILNSQPGVPYRESSDSSPLARASVEECYRRIHRDLDQSIRWLERYQPVNATHISLKVAYGLKARVYLAQQNYADCARYAGLAIRVAESDGCYLMSGDECLNGFSRLLSQSGEALWCANTQDDQSVAFFSFYSFMSWNFYSSAVRNSVRCINSRLYSELSAGDIRLRWWDPTGKIGVPSVAYRQFAYQNRKFSVENTTVSAGDYPWMRLSELYLMKAEALARSGDDAGARKVLYDFMVTRDESYQLSSFSGERLCEEIMTHRRVELWGEGFRFTDLKRLNQGLDRNNSNYLKSVASVMEVEAGSPMWEWLIPEAEINASMGLVVQND